MPKMIISGYTDFSLSKAGILSECLRPSMAARIKLQGNISRLFPYINAVFKEARFYSQPRYIQFIREEIQCILYPDEAVLMPFSSKGQARWYINDLIGFLNELHARKASLVPDYKTIARPISAIDVYKLLPGTNCKKCGYNTCLAFAAALGRHAATPAQCPGFKAPLYESATYPVFDQDGNLKTTVSIELSGTNQESGLKQKKGRTTEIESRLTRREIEVLQLITEGATNTEIAAILCISPHTVKSHVINIFNKIGVNDRTQAAVWATRYGIEDLRRNS